MRMRVILITLLLGVLTCGIGLAGPLATHPDAWWDPVGLFYWRGSTNMVNGNLSATVDWAVFGPGDYPGTNYTPDAGEFVYSYQVISTGSLPVTQFTVNMIESNEANDIGDDQTLVAGTAPLAAAFGSPPPALQTANWYFAGLVSGDNSDGLVYSSVNMPILDMGRVVDGGTYAEGALPSPSDVIPEPATLGLLALGLVAVLGRRR